MPKAPLSESGTWSARFPSLTDKFSEAKNKPDAIEAEYNAFAALQLDFDLLQHPLDQALRIEV